VCSKLQNYSKIPWEEIVFFALFFSVRCYRRKRESPCVGTETEVMALSKLTTGARVTTTSKRWTGSKTLTMQTSM